MSFKFLMYLLRNGSLRIQPPDFGKEFDDAFLSQSRIAKQTVTSSVYVRMRNRLMRIPYINTLISNIAYIKSARKINTQFIVVDSLHLCYLRILKAGSTSILAGILPEKINELKGESLSDKQIDLLGGRFSQSELSAQEKGYETFTVVRDPFRRMVSVYLDLFDHASSHFAYTDYLFGILKKEMTFAEFVRVIKEIPDALKAPHFVPQSKIIDDACGGDMPKVFRLEKDQQRLIEFLRTHGLDFRPHNQRGAYDFRSYYSAELVELIHAMFAEDIERFGYQSEYLDLKAAVQLKNGFADRTR